MNKERLLTLSSIVLVAALSRLLPHPANVAPIAAIALFAGAYFEKKWLAFAVPWRPCSSATPLSAFTAPNGRFM
jgi:hypothetical protein